MTYSGNVYLEKVAETLEKQALNALKARQMAKEVGVIADHESNWKYALRNLRDGRGSPLQGQPRREALTRLAGGRDIVREHQQMTAAQRKLRDVDEVQQINEGKDVLVPKTGILGAAHLKDGSRFVDPLAGSNEHEIAGPLANRMQLGNSRRLSASHVHPNVNRRSATIQGQLRDAKDRSERELAIGDDPRHIADDMTPRFGRSDTPHRLAGPSGSTVAQQAMRHMGKAERSTANGIHTAQVSPGVFETTRYDPIKLTYPQKGAGVPTIGGDQGAFQNVTNNQVNPIHAPSVNTVGLHKTTTGGPLGNIPIGRRSVYLDMTPRKIKNAQ